MSFDLQGILRRRKPEKQTSRLRLRPREALATTASMQGDARPVLVPDTNVYILLTAAKMGLPVLTADWDDYDLIQQLAPEGQFVFFEV